MKIKAAASTKQTKEAASTKQIKAKASTSTEKILGHDKAATVHGGHNQPDILLALNSEDFPPLVFSNLVLYRPGDKGLDDFVVNPGENPDEVIYYGEEE